MDGAALTLQVADTGPGISTQSLPYIFDRFYRADVSRTTKEHFGLDLSIAKEPADLHGGGTLRVARTGPEGTIFALRLPLHRGDTFERTALLARGPAMQKGARRFSPARSFLCFFIG